MARATVGLNESMRDQVVTDLLIPKMTDEAADWKVRLTAVRLGHSLSASDANDHFRGVVPPVFLLSVTKLIDQQELSSLAEAFTPVMAKLDAPYAAEVTSPLLVAIQEVTNPDQLAALSKAWVEVATRLDKTLAATQAARVASRLHSAMKQETDLDRIRALAAAFSLVARASWIVEITEVFRRFTTVNAWKVGWIASLLERLPGRIDAQELMNLLKGPECVGTLQAATVGRLGRQVGQDFHGNVWEVIRHPAYAPYARTPYVPPQPLTTGREQSDSTGERPRADLRGVKDVRRDWTGQRSH